MSQLINSNWLIVAIVLYNFISLNFFSEIYFLQILVFNVPNEIKKWEEAKKAAKYLYSTKENIWSKIRGIKLF